MSIISVKEAVAAVRRFIEELYGPQQLRNTILEEIELSEEEDIWLISMSLFSPSSFITGLDNREKDLKLFRVDAETGDVLSMKIKE